MNEKESKATAFSEASTAEQSAVECEPPTLKHVKKFKQNWRINLLATPKNMREKYTNPPDQVSTGVRPEALAYQLQERTEHMSRPAVRTLVVNKRLFTPLYRDKYEKRMDDRIELSWNSMYNVYKKARRDISRRSSEISRKSSRSSRGSRTKSAKGGKAGKKEAKGKVEKKKEKGKKKEKEKEKKGGGGGGGKTKEKTEEDIEKEIQEWINSRSKPKPVFKPEPIPRGPIADLLELKEKMDVLATPKKVTTSEPRDPTVINGAALTYEATEKIVELAKPSPWRLLKEEPYIPGAVKPEALTAKASPRIDKLAMPKITQNVHESDLKEDPFVISPNALKYVATARILELAKPKEY